MSKALMGALLAFAVIGIVAFLMTESGDIFGSSTGGGGTDEGGEGGIEVFSDTGDEGEDADPARVRGPALFGHGAAIGVGDVIGRVADFHEKAPIEGAALRITGTGHGSEPVDVATESNASGAFRLKEVPAGRDFVLEISQDGAVVRRVKGVSLSAGKIEDLGTLYLGDGGTLEGRVLSIDGTAIVGARVEAHPGAMTMEKLMQDFADLLGKLDRDPEPYGKGKSDTKGHFAVEGLPPGPITVIVRAPGHALGIKRAAMSKDGVIGEEPVFRLEPVDPISGRVIDVDGRGIAGARIAFMDQRDEETGFYGRQFTDTDGSGYFEIASPPRAENLMAIIAAEHYPTMIHEVKGQRSGLEFTLKGGATLAIQILRDDTSEPIPDATVFAMLADSDDMSMQAGGNFLTGMTDATGTVEFIARPGKMPMMFFSHPELGGGMFSPAMGGFMGAGAMLKGPKDFTLEKGDNKVVLRKPAGVLVTGVVKDADGAPISGATVNLGGGMMMMMGGSKVLTDEEGRYQLATPKMPMTALMVSAPGYVQDPASMQVTLEGDQIEHDVTMLFASAIEGTVKGPQGTPAAGVEVKIRPAGEEDNGNFAMQFASATGRIAISDESGRYLIEDVVPGKRYLVVGKSDEFVTSATDAFEVGGDERRVKAPALTMRKGLELTVEVRDPSGRAIAGASVDVHVEPTDKAKWDEFSRWRAFAKLVTNTSGQATQSNLPDGKITFTAKADGFASARKTVRATRDSPPAGAAVVRLRPSRIVAGTIRDDDGNLVEGVSVSMSTSYTIPQANGQGPTDAEEDAKWMPSVFATTDRYGRFELEGVPDVASDQPRSVYVHKEGYKDQTIQLDGPSDALQVTLPKFDPEKAKRMEELNKQLMEIYQAMGQTKDDTEREALQKQAQALRQELSSLQGDEAVSVAVPR